jgi:polyisoprenyl-phosphate glycosyltransferase|tara:strand:+ start:729 stop:1595 length:867 start_codon:yes stop_codon:yes gene_type:complete
MKHILVIPVFNDWKSLNKLIHKLNSSLKSKIKIKNEILIINDNSTEKIKLDLKKLNIIKSIKVITLKKNYGSQKAIAIGLNYLKKIKGKFFVTVMDGDGEDSPTQIKRMLLSSINNSGYVITSNRKKREEAFIIILLYKLHLIITFLFTFKWISFGNFSTFNKKNLNNLLSDNSSWYAHSSSVLKNCKIKRLYSKREKRYYDKSKLGLFSLIEHSLRVNAVFYKNIIFSSVIYLFLISGYVQNEFKYFLILGIFIFNFSIFWIKLKHYINNLSNIHSYIKKIQLIKTL